MQCCVLGRDLWENNQMQPVRLSQMRSEAWKGSRGQLPYGGDRDRRYSISKVDLGTQEKNLFLESNFVLKNLKVLM